jgi:hypothetical protein
MQKVAISLLALAALTFGGWMMLTNNVVTEAGYVDYVTEGAIFGKAEFHDLQVGPTSSGRVWLASVKNVSITPYTFNEDFDQDRAILSKDNIKVEFSVHVTWHIDPDQVRSFVEHFSTINDGDSSDKIVQTAYDNFIKENFRTYARDEVQKQNAMDIKDQMTPTADAIMARMQKLTEGTPYVITSIVIGNIQYPAVVADATAKKLAKTQELEQKESELAIAEKDKEIRIKQAEGIAAAMDIIQAKLTPFYIQHEAIEAQKAMVDSPNHSVIYIPVGNNGVPLVSTVPSTSN